MGRMRHYPSWPSVPQVLIIEDAVPLGAAGVEDGEDRMEGQGNTWVGRIAALSVICSLAGCGGGAGASTAASVAGDRSDAGEEGDTGGGDAVTGNAVGIDGVSDAPPVCTSGTSWTRGNHGSSDMNPGRSCLACHATMNGPSLTFAGTVYPTAHEPDLCDGASGADGARIVITGADGNTLMLTPHLSGNFDSATEVMLPFTAKVTYQGRTRAMTATQTSGDCNGCHTQTGVNGAPGRIVLP
jgi:hypothetical protein